MKRYIKKMILKILIITKKPFIIFDKSQFKIGIYDTNKPYYINSNYKNWLDDSLNIIDKTCMAKPIKLYINYNGKGR